MVSNNELKSCSSREVRSQRGGGFFTKSTELSALDMQLKLEENDIPMKSSTREVIEDDKNSEGDRHNTLDTGGIISASIAAEKHESNVDVEDEDETNRITPPFPWLPMTALCMGMLAHSVVFTNPLPFVAFMVVDFGMAENVDSAGYYAGWITGTFMIGRTMAGLFWGIASDRYGRRLCLLAAMFNVALFGLLLGFSTSFTMAVLLRLAIGLGNGFMGVAKTCISEICCKEHELRAFGILNGMWGLGLIVGPAVGGLLSRPALQYPSIFPQRSIWGQFPYLLPCLVCSLIAVIGFILLYMWLPETSGNHTSAVTNLTDKSDWRNTKKTGGANIAYPDLKFSVLTGCDSIDTLPLQDEEKKGNRVGEDIGNVRVIEKRKGQRNGKKNGDKLPNMDDEDCATDVELGSTSRDEIGEDMYSLFTTNTNISSPVRSSGKFTKYNPIKSFDSDVDESSGIIIEDGGSKLVITNEGEEEPGIEKMLGEKRNRKMKKSVKPQSLSEMIKNTQIRFLSILYTCFCFVIMFVDESFPLWAVTSVQKGGLSWSSGQVGSALACVGFLLVIFQLFFYERLIKNCCTSGPGGTFFGLACVSCIGIFALPLLTQLISNQFPFARNGNGNGDVVGSLSGTYTSNDSASSDIISRFYFAHTFLNCNDSGGTSVTDSLRRYDDKKESGANAANLSVVDRKYHMSSSNTATMGCISTKNSSNDSSSTHQSDLAFWCIYGTIVGCLAVYRASATSAFTTLGIVVNDSVDRELRGTLNGFIMTCGSLGNALGPILGSTLYAAAINLPRPFDGRIVFLIGALILIILAFVAKIHLQKSV